MEWYTFMCGVAVGICLVTRRGDPVDELVSDVWARLTRKNARLN